MQNEPNLLRDTLVPIIAVLAFLQPWAISLWKARYRPGRLEIHESANIELTFMNKGPSSILLGALQAINRDVFVKSIQLKVIKLSDKSEHIFDSNIYLYPKFGTDVPSPMEIPHAFLVPTRSEHIYNIVFADNDSDIWDEASKVRRMLYQRELEELRSPDITPEMKDSDKFWFGFRSQILKNFSEAFDNLEGHINRNLFWSTGRYELVISVSTDVRTKPFEKHFNFEITPNEFESLKQNAELIVENIRYNYLGLNELRLSNIFPEYEQYEES